jgi:hypothetical protein
MSVDRPKKVCYRCCVELDLVYEYMGLSYCMICREVVVAMSWLIPLGPPFGFPGAPGYLSPASREGS